MYVRRRSYAPPRRCPGRRYRSRCAPRCGPVLAADRRRAVGDFVADIPWSQAIPAAPHSITWPRTDRVRDRSDAAAVGPTGPCLHTDLASRPAAPVAARGCPPVRPASHLVVEDAPQSPRMPGRGCERRSPRGRARRRPTGRRSEAADRLLVSRPACPAGLGPAIAELGRGGPA